MNFYDNKYIIKISNPHRRKKEDEIACLFFCSRVCSRVSSRVCSRVRSRVSSRVRSVGEETLIEINFLYVKKHISQKVT